MGKGAAGKQAVADYTLSIHFRIAWPVDEILGIYIGEKEAWSGSATAETDIAITRPDLFGGVKKEGGTVGSAYYLPGGPNQVMPEHLANRLGLTSATCPGYRSMASLFFTGGASLYGAPGFLWGSNNPYLKTVWVKVRRRSRGLDPAYALIDGDSNPVHIIYEALTNTDWGQGGAPSGLNTPVWEAAARVIHGEGLGLSLTWTKQTDIEAFVQEVLDHIQATVFVNPREGLMTIKLIRADYVIADLPILNADNCTVTSFDRKGLGETVNEVVVTYTDPENEQEATVAAQNNANIAAQGGIISDSRNFYGVRRTELAQELAVRELTLVSAPLASYEITADRTAWDFVPGGCARLQFPEYGFDDVVIRLGKIDYGKPGQPGIDISAIEDVFARIPADFQVAPATEWADEAVNPTAPQYARIITAPLFLVTRTLRAADVAQITYPEVVPAVLSSTQHVDTHRYDLFGVETLPNGQVVAESVSSRPMLGNAIVPALVAEAQSRVQFGDIRGGPGPRPGGLVFIGNVNEYGQEIALLQSVDDTGWFLKRGVLDTIPRAWPANTPVFFVNVDSELLVESAVHAAGETVTFRIAPASSRGTLSFAAAPAIAATLSGRPHLPLRPAAVTAGGVAFGTADLSATVPAAIPITWATRNRTLEDAQILGWTDGPVVPEQGQTVTIRVIATNGTILATHSGITGNSFDLPSASFGDQHTADIAVSAVRDNLESLQNHRIRVKIRTGGWGDDWGLSWGGGNPAPGSPSVQPTPTDPPVNNDNFPPPAPGRDRYVNSNEVQQ